MFRYLSVFLCLFLLTACEQQSGAPKEGVIAHTKTAVEKVPDKTFSPLKDPLDPHLFELPTEALQIWRQYKDAKPALVLFSIHPFLEPIDAAMKNEVADLLNNGTAEDFYRRGSLARSNPALTPLQTLSAALDAGFFSEVIWFFPTREDLSNFSVERFQTQMKKAGFITEAENTKLTLQEEGIIGGTLRGVPFRIVHPLAAIPEISQPVVLHLDLGYFKGLYKNGVSTPIYNLLQETARTLHDSNYSVLDATLSYSTEGAEFSIDTRFLMNHMASLLKDPSMLNTDMPESWRLHKDALYSREMFQETEAKKIIAEAAQKFPDAAFFQYAYFQVLLQTGQNDSAFALLDKIVALDPGYAREYLTFAETAVEKNLPNKAIEFLGKAGKIYPDNPFIKLRKINILFKLKHDQEALPLIANLKKRTWSKYFYPEMPDNIDRMEAYVRNPPAQSGKSEK